VRAGSDKPQYGHADEERGKTHRIWFISVVMIARLP
jgi:hypothetical protein